MPERQWWRSGQFNRQRAQFDNEALRNEVIIAIGPQRIDIAATCLRYLLVCIMEHVTCNVSKS
jgi:hypothetical protein